MTQLSEEQQERLRRIQESDQRWRQNAPDLGDVMAGLESDIDFLLSLLDSDSQAAATDRLRRGLESIRDCTPDMWACSMAEQTLSGASFKDALAASKKYDTEDGFDAAATMRDKCVAKVKEHLACEDLDGAHNVCIEKLIPALESLTLDTVEQEKQ